MSRLTHFLRHAALPAILLGLVSAPARADVFVLANGGQVRGEIVNRDESPRKTYVIKTATGQVTLDKSQVKEVQTQTAAQSEYEELAPRAPDTVDGQWMMAEWCREHHLSKERVGHLERVLELDPNHRGAHLGLGYVQMEGRWVRPDQVMEERGYVRFDGKWRLPQEIEILKQQKKDDVAEKGWYTKLKRLRDMLDDERMGTKARDELQNIDDPYAVAAISDFLEKENEPSVRPLYVRSLGKIATTPALQELVRMSLEDDDEEVRVSSVEQLVAHKNPSIVSAYVAGLKSKDNVEINRAAVGLAQMKDPSSVGPLIDALVTRHRYKVSNGTNSNQIGASFSKDSNGNVGPGGLSVGAAPPKYVTQDMTNREVLAALAGISGVNFGYDVRAWRYWYQSQKKPEAPVDMRRGN